MVIGFQITGCDVTGKVHTGIVYDKVQVMQPVSVEMQQPGDLQKHTVPVGAATMDMYLIITEPYKEVKFIVPGTVTKVIYPKVSPAGLDLPTSNFNA
jgi:hypothetical protein